MAHYFLFPEKDATIYSHPTRLELNSSLDEILQIAHEASDTVTDSYYPSRALIQFKQSEIVDVLANKATSEFSASLKLFQTEHTELSLDQHFEVFALSQSWDNGTGRYSNSPITSDGCSWSYRDNDTVKTSWYPGNFGNATGSWEEGNIGGGLWYYTSGFYASRSYSYGEELDLSLDVTNITRKHYSGSELSKAYPDGVVNNGLIVKRKNSQEFTSTNKGTLNYFSRDTHTIYPPYLDISWDDSNYDTSIVTDDKIKKSGQCYVTLRNNKGTYYKEEETTFRLNVRELYPTRRFVTSSNYLDVKYFTSESYYSLIDYATEEVVIPFDNHTKLSADAEGMYFKLYMNGLQEERYYKLLFKHENNDGITIYNEDYYFKVTKS